MRYDGCRRRYLGEQRRGPLPGQLVISRFIANYFLPELLSPSSPHFGAVTGRLEDSCGSKLNSTLTRRACGHLWSRKRSSAEIAASSIPVARADTFDFPAQPSAPTVAKRRTSPLMFAFAAFVRILRACVIIVNKRFPFPLRAIIAILADASTAANDPARRAVRCFLCALPAQAKRRIPATWQHFVASGPPLWHCLRCQLL